MANNFDLCVHNLLADSSKRSFVTVEGYCSFQPDTYYQCLCDRYNRLVQCFTNNCATDTVNVVDYQHSESADCSIASQLGQSPTVGSATPPSKQVTIDIDSATAAYIIVLMVVGITALGGVVWNCVVWIRRWRATKAEQAGPVDPIPPRSATGWTGIDVSHRCDPPLEVKLPPLARAALPTEVPSRMSGFGIGLSMAEPVPPPSLDGLMPMSDGAGFSTMVDKGPISVVEPSRGERSSTYSITMDAVTSPDVETWSTLDVARWLEDKLQLRPAIVNAFKGSNVDGARLRTLTDEDLRVQMGLSEEAKIMFRAALERLTRDAARNPSGVSPPPYHSKLPDLPLVDSLRAASARFHFPAMASPISITGSTFPTLQLPSCYRALNALSFPFTSPNSSAPFGLPPSIFPASNNDPSLLCSPLCHSLAASVHADPAAVGFVAYNNQLKTGVPCVGLAQGDRGLCCKCLLLPDLEGVLLAPQVDDAACPLCVDGMTGRCSDVQAGLIGGSVVWIERVNSTAAFATGQVVSFVPFTTFASTSGVTSATTTTAAEQTHVGSSSTPSTGAIAGGVVGAIAALGVMAAAVAVWVRRKRREVAAKGAARGAAIGAGNVDLVRRSQGGMAGLEVSIPYKPRPAGVTTVVAPVEASIPYEPAVNVEPAPPREPVPPRRAGSLAVEPTREVVAATAKLSKIVETSRPANVGLGVDVQRVAGAELSTTLLGKLPTSVVDGPGISASKERTPPLMSGGTILAPGDAFVMPDVRTWSTQDVARWLEDKLQLRKAIVNAFIGSGVDGARLVTLTDKDLSVEMGLSDEAKLMFRAALERLTGGSVREQSEVAPPPYHSRLPST
ncbi:hypothetical protein HK101_000993 [Irineochytrium annulatum]|nr:hypothetical protein HK101_000993 [Irineochytrium annulatum]